MLGDAVRACYELAQKATCSAGEALLGVLGIGDN